MRYYNQRILFKIKNLYELYTIVHFERFNCCATVIFMNCTLQLFQQYAVKNNLKKKNIQKICFSSKATHKML